MSADKEVDLYHALDLDHEFSQEMLLSASTLTSMNALKSIVTCAICQDLMFFPCTISCGHTFCLHCLSEWFKKNKQYSCPTCRHKVKARPSLSHAVRSVTQELATISAQGNSAKLKAIGRYLDEVKHRYTSARLDELFEYLPQFARRIIVDNEDGVVRCPQCSWEMEGGYCHHCNFTTAMSDTDLYGNSTDEEDEDEEMVLGSHDEEDEAHTSDLEFLDDEVSEDLDASDISLDRVSAILQDRRPTIMNNRRLQISDDDSDDSVLETGATFVETLDSDGDLAEIGEELDSAPSHGARRRAAGRRVVDDEPSQSVQRGPQSRQHGSRLYTPSDDEDEESDVAVGFEHRQGGRGVSQSHSTSQTARARSYIRDSDLSETDGQDVWEDTSGDEVERVYHAQDSYAQHDGEVSSGSAGNEYHSDEDEDYDPWSY